MKTLFKVLTIFILVVNTIAGVIGILGLSAANKVTEGKSGGEAALGGVAVLVILFSLIPIAVTIFMAICGLRGKYNTCFKISFVLMVVNIVSFVLSDNKAGAVFSLALSIFYCFLAKKMDDGAY